MNGLERAASIDLGIYDSQSEDAQKRRTQWFSTPRGRFHLVFSVVASSLLLCGTAIAMLAVAAPTLFRKRRLYTEGIAHWLAKTTLRVNGVKMAVHQQRAFPQEQTIYVANHTSTLDMFILLALGLPNTRYFLRGKYRRIIPLGIITYIMGTFFTPSQTRPAARVKCFQNAERVLRHTGDSVYLSPEGKRVTDGKIGHFNKGTFHLATNLKIPIVPLFIDIPPAVNPGTGYGVMPGTVHVYVLPEIRTDEWRIEDMQNNKEMVRDLYVRFQQELRAQKPTADHVQTGIISNQGA
jgi:1-acyl-sn-glycerol-3-phosphate acyltransferase